MSIRRRVGVIVALCVVAPLAACGIANPWPNVPVPENAHHELLVIGDSLAGQTDVTLAGVFAAKGYDVTVIDAHVNGSGLIGPVPDPDGTIYPGALEYVNAKLDQFPQADTVLVEWAGACTVCAQGTPAFSTPEFFDQWTANAHAVIDAIKARGKVPVWAISPPMGMSADWVASGAAVRIESCRVLNWFQQLDYEPYAAINGVVGVVDWYHALADIALQYQTWLFYDGALHQVRTDDLTHLTMDGSTRASTWTVKGIGDLWAALARFPHTTRTSGEPHPAGLIQAGDPVTLTG